jgi:hypothetical protein
VNNVLDTMGYSSTVEANYQTYAFTGINGPLPTAPPAERTRRRLSGVAWAFELLKRGIPAGARRD